MDYANGILLNVPDITIKPYQCLQNMSAKITLNRAKHSSTTEALKNIALVASQSKNKL